MADVGEPGKAPRAAKRAVLIIHGMGNQAPMTTLRGFVEAVWTNDPKLKKRGKPRIWSKRDPISGSHELRRITTTKDRDGVRTDFFEFYWAHLVEGTRLSNVLWWFSRLFLRPPHRVPHAVRALWLVGIVGGVLLLATLVVWALAALMVIRTAPVSLPRAAGWGALAIAFGLFWWVTRHQVMVAVVGDAVRYLTAAPENINARAAIRTAGLQLLARLHADDAYDRIVVVGHSLGSVVGYDLLAFYWGEINGHIKDSRKAIFGPLERAGAALVAASEGTSAETERLALAAFREAQAAARNRPDFPRKIWKVTDFVTLGSPLTHAHFLMVDDNLRPLASELRALEGEAPHRRLTAWFDRHRRITGNVAVFFGLRMVQREFGVSPPLPEREMEITYPVAGEKRVRIPHHAAQFAVTRWTNIFAPRRRVLWGDAIGGPVAPLFGPGVKDVSLEGRSGRSWIAHTRYWEPAQPGSDGKPDREHLEALRAAVNLLDESEDVAWQRYRDEIAPPPAIGGDSSAG